MRAEIISIGTEILLADIQDTNSHYIAQRLPALGVDLYYMHQVGDNVARLGGLIRTALDRSDVVICTGGLGPTEDDITRDAIARAVGEEARVDPGAAATLRAFFAGRGSDMPARNIKQATIIPSGTILPNPRGTAPGWWVENADGIVVAMPGPPAEMTGMWANEVAPRLAARSDGDVIVSRTLKTVGIGEATVDEMASPLLKSRNPTIGVYAKSDGIHLRLTAKAVWGADETTLAGGVGDLLRERGLSVAVMESLTGGLVASTLTDVAGSSDYFRGGLVTYSEATKIRYGVPAETIAEHGVVSEATAVAMATAVREALGADIGIGVTGVAGPAAHGGQPVGTTHIGVATATGRSHSEYVFAQTRAAIKRRAVTSCLLLLRRAALGQLREKEQIFARSREDARRAGSV